MAKHIVRLILVFLGLASPVSTPVTVPMPVRMPVHHMKAKPPVIAVKKHPAQSDFAFGTYSFLKKYTYRFEGKAAHGGIACANASVLVRIISNDETFTKGGLTDQDGNYSIEMTVMATEGTPVDWHMEAFSSEFRKLELSGRRIVQEEEETSTSPIVVTSPVEFKLSSAK